MISRGDFVEVLAALAAIALAGLSYLGIEAATPKRYRRRELIRNWGRTSLSVPHQARWGALWPLLSLGLPKEIVQLGSGSALPAWLGSPERVVLVRLVLAGFGLGSGILVPAVRGQSSGFATGLLLGGGIWIALPLLAAILVDSRKARMVGAFPGMVQTLSLLAGTGLTTMQAFRTAVPCIREPLRTEVRLLVAEMGSSLVPEDALERFAARTGVPEVRAFTRMIAQERKAGIRLAEILVKQAAFARRLRVQLVRKRTSFQPYLLTLTVGLLFLNLFLIYMVPRAVDFLRFLDQ